MAEAIGLVGTDVGVPILVFRDDATSAAISGPVVSPAPTGKEALPLWDHVVGVAWASSFYELKRPALARHSCSQSGRNLEGLDGRGRSPVLLRLNTGAG